jgi:soluble lytic murein transglycosylase-like protein
MRAFFLALAILACALPAAAAERDDALIARHAQANGVPEALVRRVILRESRYDAGAVGRGGAMGLMQIKHATARAMGYAGPAHGLLDADTNLTYAVRYLAGAYRAARGDQALAFSLYQRGYYYEAKRQRLGLN